MHRVGLIVRVQPNDVFIIAERLSQVVKAICLKVDDAFLIARLDLEFITVAEETVLAL